MRDDEPLLFHIGSRVLFPEVKAAVASLIDSRTLRWIGFSHFYVFYIGDGSRAFHNLAAVWREVLNRLS